MSAGFFRAPGFHGRLAWREWVGYQGDECLRMLSRGACCGCGWC